MHRGFPDMLPLLGVDGRCLRVVQILLCVAVGPGDEVSLIEKWHPTVGGRAWWAVGRC